MEEKKKSLDAGHILNPNVSCPKNRKAIAGTLIEMRRGETSPPTCKGREEVIPDGERGAVLIIRKR